MLRKKSVWAAAGVFVMLLLLPPVIPRFYTYILTVVFVMALFAMSLNMLVGHGGLFQFHHAAFYGVGAYTAALIFTKTSLSFWVGFFAGPVAAALAGLVIGLFCVRLSNLYFGMLQISLGSLLWAIALRWYSLTGGDDGIHGIPVPQFIASQHSTYYFNLTVLGTCLVVLYLIFKSPFGTTLQAIRDNPERCEAVGINVRRHKLLAITIATFFAGVAGVMFVILERSVFPDLLFWVLSLEIFIMCLLGGWFTFAGPVLGAAIIVSLRTFVGTYTEYWTFAMGVILILLIFFLPEGVVSLAARLFGPKFHGADKEGRPNAAG